MSASDRPPQRPNRPGWLIALTVLLIIALAVATANLWMSGRLARQQQDDSKQHAFWVLCQPGYSSEVRKGAFLLLVAQGNKEWRSASLADLNLDKASLPEAYLAAAAFRQSKLTGANLTGAVFDQKFFRDGRSYPART